MVTSTTSRTLQLADDEIVIGEGVALGVPPAGFLLRAGSAIIDVGLVLICYVLSIIGLVTLIESWIRNTGAQFETAWVFTLITVWAVLWFVAVPITVEVLTHGRSVGKLIFGLRIVRLDGGAITFRHSLVRGLLGAAEFYLTSGAIAAVTGMLTRRSQRVGDLLAGTYAQLERPPKAVPLVLQMPPQLAQWEQLVDVSKLPDRLSRRIRDFFRQADRLDPASRQRLAGTLAREAKPYVHPIPDVDAETFLLAVSVVRRDREWRGMQARARRLQPVAESFERSPHGFPNRG
ncbi:RDD family protein [Gulosibacter macacae]|nr:RDD family protein [Gulosibacter macacae]